MQVLQLYEMLAVRHGIMVVGLPLAGKSAVLQTLAAALSALAAAGEAGELFERVDVAAINPKAVTMGELYGANDRATQEWRARPSLSRSTDLELVSVYLVIGVAV